MTKEVQMLNDEGTTRHSDFVILWSLVIGPFELLSPAASLHSPPLMKAERRHELKTNTLAQGLGGLPAFWAVHGTKVLLGVVAVLAVVLFIRFQANSARQQQAMSEEALSNAQTAIDSLRGLAGLRDPKLIAEQRREIQSQADQALRQVLDDSKDEPLRASAL